MTVFVNPMPCQICGGTTYYDDSTCELWCEGRGQPCNRVKTKAVNLFKFRKLTNLKVQQT